MAKMEIVRQLTFNGYVKNLIRLDSINPILRTQSTITIIINVDCLVMTLYCKKPKAPK